MRALAVAGVALLAAACADGRGHGGYGSGEGDVDPHVVDVRPVRSAEVDYVVLIRNDDDLGFNAEDPEVRRNAAIKAVRRYCDGARVVNERWRDTGARTRYNLPVMTYEIELRCAG